MPFDPPDEIKVQKTFCYIVRLDGSGPRLLAFISHEEPGFEVPKGAVEPGESLEDGARREMFEESGLSGLPFVRWLGRTVYAPASELQHFALFWAAPGMPKQFSHTITGEGGDRGMVYAFHWLPVNTRLKRQLVQGSGQFVDELIKAMENNGCDE